MFFVLFCFVLFCFYLSQGHAPAVRYNRALSLRRGRLGLDVDTLPASTNKDQRRNANGSPSRGVSPQVTSGRKHSMSSSTTPMTSSQAKTTSSLPSGNSSFSRSDGGRFSLRIGAKASSSASATPPNNSSSSAAAVHTLFLLSFKSIKKKTTKPIRIPCSVDGEKIPKNP